MIVIICGGTYQCRAGYLGSTAYSNYPIQHNRLHCVFHYKLVVTFGSSTASALSMTRKIQ